MRIINGEVASQIVRAKPEYVIRDVEPEYVHIKAALGYGPDEEIRGQDAIEFFERAIAFQGQVKESQPGYRSILDRANPTIWQRIRWWYEDRRKGPRLRG